MSPQMAWRSCKKSVSNVLYKREYSTTTVANLAANLRQYGQVLRPIKKVAVMGQGDAERSVHIEGLGLFQTHRRTRRGVADMADARGRSF